MLSLHQGAKKGRDAMSEPHIRLALKEARTILEFLETFTLETPARRRARDELRRVVAAHAFCRALAYGERPKFPKPSAADRQATKRREEAAQARKDRKVYAAVTVRAGGKCEHCGRAFGTGLADKDVRDHFFGRGKEPTTIPLVWVLCNTCNDEKTRNAPTHAAWLRAYLIHCNLYGYREQAARCVRELEAERQIERANEMMEKRGPGRRSAMVDAPEYVITYRSHWGPLFWNGRGAWLLSPHNAKRWGTKAPAVRALEQYHHSMPDGAHVGRVTYV